MRLIDVDAVTFPTPYRKEVNAYMRGWNLCLRSVSQQPTVDAVPVVHGYWITCIRHEHYPSGKEYEEDYCSVCGKRGSREYDYCPGCGAKMDKEMQPGDDAEKRLVEDALRNMEESIVMPVVDVTRWQYTQLTEEAKQKV